MPVVAEDRPHHAHQSQMALGLSQTEPADPEGRAEQTRRDAGGFPDRVLRPCDLAIDELRTAEVETRMRVGMVADFMTRGGHRARDLRAASHVFSAHEEGCRDIVSRKNL